MSYLSYKAERAGRRVVKVDSRNASLNILRAGSGLPREPLDRKPLLYNHSEKGMYSKFPGRREKSSSRGEDAPVSKDGVVHKQTKCKFRSTIKAFLLFLERGKETPQSYY